jgi:hypothetical protein
VATVADACVDGEVIFFYRLARYSDQMLWLQTALSDRNAPVCKLKLHEYWKLFAFVTTIPKHRKRTNVNQPPQNRSKTTILCLRALSKQHLPRGGLAASSESLLTGHALNSTNARNLRPPKTLRTAALAVVAFPLLHGHRPYPFPQGRRISVGW